jgi:hypothetical protein
MRESRKLEVTKHKSYEKFRYEPPLARKEIVVQLDNSDSDYGSDTVLFSDTTQ